MTRQQPALLGLTAFCAAAILLAPAARPVRAEQPADPIAGITTYPPAQLAEMDRARRNASSTGKLYVSAEIVRRGEAYRKMLASKGDRAVADQLLSAYPGDDAWRDFAAVAVALQRDAGYIPRVSTGDRGLDRTFPRKSEPDGKKLASTVLALVDEIAGRDHPLAESAAIEVLLQVLSEALPGQHLYADNGRRSTPTMPEALVERAAGFLGSDDPFVRAMADWAVSIKVCLDNDNKGKGEVWPGANPPGWYERWAAVPDDEHLPFDYARQAISLGMHRRGTDLLTLAADVMRRAEAKADWARSIHGGDDRAVAAMREAMATLTQTVKAGDLASQRAAWLTWRRTARLAVLSGKDIDFEKIIYLKRFSGGHHIQPTIHANKYPPGGDIYIQDGLEPTSPTTPVIGEKLPPGYVQDLDLWYEADKLVFSRTDGPRRGSHQQLYEMGVDGEGLRQLTDSNYEDVDPAWLPDGSVVFGSTRAEAGIMCLNAGAHHTNIYRLLPDKETIWRLSYCKDDDAYPYVLNDGRVVFMRWDYQERGVDEIFSLWAVRPDGSYADGFFRVHIPDRLIIQALKGPRPIPDSQKLVAMGSSHRAGNEGTIVVCDVKAGINNPRAIRDVTPYHSTIGRGSGELMRPVEEGGVPYIGGYYAQPWALSEKTFLVSGGYDMPISCNFHAYYIDAWGNKELLHRDKLMEAMAVVPLRPRPAPPIIAPVRDPEKTYATCYVENVYNDLPGVEKGQVKYLRILEQLFWMEGCEFTGSFQRPSGTGQGATRVIGIVPVAEDGSAAFEVPSDCPVYFQALDEHYRGIQRMRTHVEFAPGEVRGCMGCHETKSVATPPSPTGLASAKKPVRPTPPPWGDTAFIDYEKMIQPVLEAKCVKCHSGDKPKGNLLLTSKKGPRGFMQSYRSFFGLPAGETFPKSRHRNAPDNETWKAMTERVCFFFRETNGEVTRPMQFGSPHAPLAKKLVGDPAHRKLLTDGEMRLFMAWLDVRAPYYSHYVRRRKQAVRVKAFEPFGEVRTHKVVEVEK
jgi:hypothetical protein